METILFLHGWGGGSQSFAPVWKFFEKRFICLAPSLPMFEAECAEGGTCESAQSCPDDWDYKPTKPWTLEDYAEFVERFLDDNTVQKCHIVAHSFGARVAVLLVNRNKARYGRIVLTGAAGIKPRKRLIVLLKIWCYKIRKKLFGAKARGGSSDYRKLSPVGRRTFQNILNRRLEREISQICNPTLLIYGKNDKATPPWMGRKWAKISPVAELNIYNKSSHFCYIDEPARFNAEVYLFLSTG